MKKKIKKTIESLYPDTFQKRLVMAIWYGNRDGADIDLLLVAKDQYFYSASIIGKYDFILMSPELMTDYAIKYDPIVTEPILGGELLFGDTHNYKKLRYELTSTKIDSNKVSYLEMRSIEERLRCYKLIENFENSLNSVPFWFFVNLSYAVSYHLYYLWYSNNEGPVITFSRLKTEMNSYSETLDSLKKFKRSPKPVSVKQAKNILLTLEKNLLQIT